MLHVQLSLFLKPYSTSLYKFCTPVQCHITKSIFTMMQLTNESVTNYGKNLEFVHSHVSIKGLADAKTSNYCSGPEAIICRYVQMSC